VIPDIVTPLNVCVAVQLCASPRTARVLVIAGRVRVTVPRAPVGGDKVIVPEVAFAKEMLPTVDPAVPMASAPPLRVMAAEPVRVFDVPAAE